MLKTAVVMLSIVLASPVLGASGGPPFNPAERAKGAAKVVLATVTDVESEFGENAYGDRLILSQVRMQVNETMKGAHEGSLVVTLEGGTVGDLTLDVSDMPTMEKGERAVLFLSSTPGGSYVPSGRGAGVVKVDDDDRVVGENLTIDDVRAAVKASQGRGNQ